jgi:hypothetical protein
VIETKKVVETKKNSEPSVEKIPEKSATEKIPEKGTAEASEKKNLTILKRLSQPEVSPINLPCTYG